MGGKVMLQQCRKNPPPGVREAQGNGIYLLAHGEPHDPCPEGVLKVLLCYSLVVTDSVDDLK